MNARRLILAIVATLCVSVGGLVSSGAVAFAELERPSLYELTGTTGESFSGDVCGVTLDPATQDLYVADLGNDAIDIFEPSGGGEYVYKSQIPGMGVLSGVFTECSIAVSDTTGDVYVAPDRGRGGGEGSGLDVYVFSELGWSTMTGAETPAKDFSQPAVGVDNGSESPNKGDVYVSDSNDELVDRFGPENKYLSQLIPSCKKGENCVSLLAPVVNMTGEVYVAQTGFIGGKHHGIYKFSSAGKEVLFTVTGAPNVFGGGIAIDSAGNLYVTNKERGEVYEFSPSGVFLSASNVRPSFVNPYEKRQSVSVAVNANGTELFVADAHIPCSLNPSCVEVDGVVDVFGTAVTFPDVVTGEASSVTDSSATIAGTVDPDGVATTYRFEYGTSAEYGSVAPAVPGNVEPTDSSVHGESASLTGLQPSTVYHYRLVATGAGGHVSFGVDRTFRTTGPPTIGAVSVGGVSQTSGSVRAEVNPGGFDTSVFVEYGTSTEYGSGSTPVDIGSGVTPVGIGSGGVGQPPPIELAGLQAGTTYHFRVVASNSQGAPVDGADATFTTHPAVVVAGESVSEVGTNGATLNAQVDDFGVASTYSFEYGPTIAYGSTTPSASLPAAGGDVGASVPIAGLQPDSAYHCRIVVSNIFGTVPGGDLVFRTFGPTVSSLPDGRVYEMVNPATSSNTEIYVPSSPGVDKGEHGLPTELPFEAASDGEAVAYVGDSPASGGNGSFGEGKGNEYLATRAARGGWTQVDIQPPGGGTQPQYVAFSSDLSAGMLFSGEPLSAQAPPAFYQDLYAHAIGGTGYQPAFGVTPSHRGDVEFRSAWGGQPHQLFYAGGSSAFGHVLFEANDSLTGDAPVVTGLQDDLYDSVGGDLYLVNVLPDDEPVAGATFGSVAATNANLPGVTGAISADGSRIYWSALETVGGGQERAKALYVRENDTQSQSPIEDGGCAVLADACTVQVDAAEPGAPGPGGGGVFWAASGDGSRVLFTDEQRLTEDSTAAPGEPDLYECELVVRAGRSQCALSDLTVETPGVEAKAGERAGVQGVLGTSQDGQYVYFAATGVLSGENAEHHSPIAGQDNVYLSHAGVTTFIATLSAEDDKVLVESTQVAYAGDWQADLGRRTAEVTPDGHSLLFMSGRSITGYDNVLENEPLSEVFLYNVGLARVVCVSCDPSGESPVATVLANSVIKSRTGGFVPVSWSATYQPRVISEDGDRVFFDSTEALARNDTNGLLDVYEWEREGTGPQGAEGPESSCPVRKPERPGGGCVFLLSGGTSTESSYLVDASTSGNDVFVVSRAQLVPQDRGDDDNLFDVRVDGVKPVVGSACTGTGCQGVPPAPPIFATPSSATFNGTGNFQPSSPPAAAVKPAAKAKPAKCKRGFVKKKGVCVKKPKKKSKKAGKSSASKGRK